MGELNVTIFGGTGFIGRHLSARLIRSGHRLTLVARHAAQTGSTTEGKQVRSLRGDVLKRETVARAVEDADAVINLVGAVALPDAQTYFELHEDGARNVAEAARAAGVSRMIQVSALGVASDAPSAADRSKAAGESAVRFAFPRAVIVRPSLVFAEDDHFLNRFAAISRVSPVIPVIGGRVHFQPVHVDDLAEAFVRILELPGADGHLFQAAGAEVYTLEGLIHLLLAALGRRRLVAPLPFALAFPLATLLRVLPHAPIDREQVALLMTDKVAVSGIPGLADLGIHPRSLRQWLQPGRSFGDALAR